MSDISQSHTDLGPESVFVNNLSLGKLVPASSGTSSVSPPSSSIFVHFLMAFCCRLQDLLLPLFQIHSRGLAGPGSLGLGHRAGLGAQASSPQ